MSRWKAAAIHFSMSFLVFLALLSIILLLWYPGILFSIDGGWSGLRLVMGVDLILGPLLTLVVFKSAKPGLKFDLGCIVTAQVACMFAGLWIVHKERPIALVLAYDTIYSVAAQEFEDYEKDTAILGSFPGSYPKLIYVELPESDIAADIAFVRSQFMGDPCTFKPLITEPCLAILMTRQEYLEEKKPCEAVCRNRCRENWVSPVFLVSLFPRLAVATFALIKPTENLVSSSRMNISRLKP